MKSFTGLCCITLALLVGLQNSARSEVPSIAAGIVDELGLFRPEIAARADALISDLRQKYTFDVRVETLELPAAERKKIAAMPGVKQKGKYFEDLGKERAEKADVNGLYILICTNPRYVHVTAHPASAAAFFSYKDRERLEQSLRTATVAKGRHDAAEIAVGFAWRARPASGPDQALLDTLKRLKTTLEERAEDPNAVRPWTIGMILAGGVGCWFLLTLLQQRMAERAPDAGILGPMDPDRRPALLAAQFGSPAGHWISDRLFFGGPAHPASSPPPTFGQAPALPDSMEAIQSDLLHPDPDHAEATTRDGIN